MKVRPLSWARSMNKDAPGYIPYWIFYSAHVGVSLLSHTVTNRTVKQIVRSGIRTHAWRTRLRPERSALDRSAILTFWRRGIIVVTLSLCSLLIFACKLTALLDAVNQNCWNPEGIRIPSLFVVHYIFSETVPWIEAKYNMSLFVLEVHWEVYNSIVYNESSYKYHLSLFHFGMSWHYRWRVSNPHNGGICDCVPLPGALTIRPTERDADIQIKC